jgi:hypothetical protein
VAAVLGIVLTAVTAGVLSVVVAASALPLVSALLAESYGREVWRLWRGHRAGSGAASESVAVGSVHA